MAGDDWQRFANLRALYAWMWALPGAPLLFMGAELAAWTEWNDSGGLPWHLLEHAPHRGVRDLLVDAERRGRPVAGRVGARPRRRPASSGSMPTTPSTRCSPSSGGLTPGPTRSRASANFTPVPRGGYRVGLPWAGDVADRGRHRCDAIRRRRLAGRANAVEADRRDAVAGSAVPRPSSTCRRSGVVWLAAHRP